MKNYFLNKTFVFVVLLTLMGCGGGKFTTDSFITVDVTANYPKKDLILQDFMNVEYIPLKTTDEFIIKGKVADVGKNILILTNVRQGEILIFDRSTGQGLKKINRRGQGPEEYILPFNVHLNKEENELFVNDGPSSKIQVYDLEGNYKKRSFIKKEHLLRISTIMTIIIFFLKMFMLRRTNLPRVHSSYCLKKMEAGRISNFHTEKEYRR